MSAISSLRKAASFGGSMTLLVLELSKAAMILKTRRDASKKVFRRTLVSQRLPDDVVEELSQAYDDSLIHLREIVRNGAPW